MKGIRISRLRALLLVACFAVWACPAMLLCSCAGASHSLVGEVATAVNLAHGAAKPQGFRGYDASQPSTIDPTSLLGVPGSSDIMVFDADGSTSAAASDPSLAAVRAAVEDIEENGACGFMFVDAVTGRGIAYNADEALYIASAAKAPVSFYAVLQGAGGNQDERDFIADAIMHSDNDSYEMYAYDYADTAYSRWLVAHDVDHENYSYDLYPPMSARSLACVWLEILQYVQSGADDALWFADLLSSTDTSFIRDALQGSGAAVMNKGGWINEGSDWIGGYDEDGEAVYGDMVYHSVSDAGIVEFGGRSYIMAIVTDQPDDGQAEANVAALAEALFDARSLL